MGEMAQSIVKHEEENKIPNKHDTPVLNFQV
jgi:hypothetical protein